jgi:uncharacterized membrane protein (UPF0127 family)
VVAIGLSLAVIAGPVPVGVAVAADASVRQEDALRIEAKGTTHPFRVEVAATPEARTRGLMYRDHLAEDAGMLFVWPRSQPVRMWMKNTLVPLDMLFLDDAGRIVGVVERAVPHDLTPLGPDRPVRAVLELAGGTVRRLGLAEGQRVRHPALDSGSMAAPGESLSR